MTRPPRRTTSMVHRHTDTSGLTLQIGCPDLAMARHMTDQNLSDAEFLKRVEKRVEALIHATVAIATRTNGKIGGTRNCLTVSVVKSLYPGCPEQVGA